MKFKIILSLLFFACLFSTQSAIAAPTVVYYGNGVNNSKIDADLSLRRLMVEVRDHMPDEDLEFELAYNRTVGVVGEVDFLEAFKQKLELLGLDTIISAKTFMRIIFSLNEPSDDIKQLLIEEHSNYLSKVVTGNIDLQRHIEMYKANLQNGKKIVLVAHSQGNLFANQAYSLLTTDEKQCFRIVAVGTPASNVAGGGPHFTSHVDLYMSQLPTALGSNVDNDFNYGDWSGHDFIESYMGIGAKSEQLIVEAAVASVLDVKNYTCVNSAFKLLVGAAPTDLSEYNQDLVDRWPDTYAQVWAEFNDAYVGLEYKVEIIRTFYTGHYTPEEETICDRVSWEGEVSANYRLIADQMSPTEPRKAVSRVYMTGGNSKDVLSITLTILPDGPSESVQTTLSTGYCR